MFPQLKELITVIIILNNDTQSVSKEILYLFRLLRERNVFGDAGLCQPVAAVINSGVIERF